MAPRGRALLSEASRAAAAARRLRYRRVWPALFVGVALHAGCRSATGLQDTPLGGPAPDPTTSWTRATPAQVGLDETAITALVKRIRDGQNAVRSLLIVRHGYLVTEEYFNGSGPNVLHTLQSVTKSVTALTTGVAIRQGRMGVRDSILPRFPDYISVINADARKRALVVEDLLTMRTGLNWSESNYATSPLKQLNECACDWIRFVLDWPMLLQPGQQFEYNSGGVILLGQFVARAVNASFTAFAKDNLFTPLGIRSVQWYTGAGGVPHTGGGLYLKAADLARLGLLVLHGGVWDGQRLLDADWLEKATSVRTTTTATWGNHNWWYGYLFWLTPLSGSAPPAGSNIVITGSGALGQWLYVIPKYDMVIVFNGYSDAYADFVAPVNYLFSDILPAIRD